MDEDEGPDEGRGAHGQRGLLIRRHPGHGELAFYRCSAPNPVGLPELVRVAGARWSVEESFQAAKGLVGLDEHQVRRWVSWRWTLIAMLAHAVLAVLAVTERASDPAPDGLIPLTCTEIVRLLNRLVLYLPAASPHAFIAPSAGAQARVERTQRVARRST